MRIESMNKDHSHSWVRISHVLSEFVTDLNKEHDDNEQETSEMQFDNFALKSNVLAFASRSNAKAKPQRRTFDSSSIKTIFIDEKLGKILNDKIIRAQKNLINFLCYGSITSRK